MKFLQFNAQYSFDTIGIIASEGELWKDARRFVSGCLKNFGMVKFESPKRDKLEERILKSTNEALMV